MHQSFKALMLLGCGAACLTSPALAQEGEGAGEARTLDVITVTSQKRAQSLQDVPLSVAVTQGTEINDQIVTNLEDLTDGSPTVTVTRTPIGDALYIRGTGSGGSSGFQQSVGTFVDGIYRGRGPAARGAFLDLERLEILRGPQPVYFGNSTIGGAFNIVSRGASDVFEANLTTSYEFEAEEWVTEIGVGGPITDTLGYRFAYKHTESDGYVTDTVRDVKVPSINNDAFRGTLEWDPTSNFTLIGKLEYSENDEDGTVLQIIDCGPETGPFGPTCNPGIFGIPGFEDDFDFNNARGGALPNGREQEDGNELDILNASINASYDFSNGLTLNSVTGLVDYENERFVDVDAGPGPAAFALAELNEEFQQFSQELRLESPTDQRLSYMVGVYYETAELEFVEDSNLGANPALLDGALVRQFYEQDQDTAAIFGSMTYELTDNLNFIFGARYSEVETDALKVQRILTLDEEPASQAVIDSVSNPFSPNPFDELDLPGNRSEESFTPSVELQWYPVDGIMVYGSYKEATKTGGFDPQIRLIRFAEPTSFDPNGGYEFDTEEAEAIEIGAKTRLFNDTVTLNIAAFDTTFDDLQVQTFEPSSATFLTTNAGSAESRGVEIETVWLATDNLTLNADATWLDATYTEFAGAQCNNAELLAFVPTPDMVQCSTTIDGQPLPFAPDFSGSIGFDFNMPISGDLEFISTGKMSFTSEFRPGQNPDPEEIQEGFEKFDLRAGIAGNDGQWELAFVGKNLTDKKTFRFNSELPASLTSRFVLIDRGRELGLQFKYNY
ncbi:MAG: TonB-dependent receptor [Pseudomonadota bacterium]